MTDELVERVARAIDGQSPRFNRPNPSQLARAAQAAIAEVATAIREAENAALERAAMIADAEAAKAEAEYQRTFSGPEAVASDCAREIAAAIRGLMRPE